MILSEARKAPRTNYKNQTCRRIYRQALVKTKMHGTNTRNAYGRGYKATPYNAKVTGLSDRR